LELSRAALPVSAASAEAAVAEAYASCRPSDEARPSDCRFVLTADLSNSIVTPARSDDGSASDEARMTILDRLHAPRPNSFSAMLLVLLIITPVTLAQASPPDQTWLASRRSFSRAWLRGRLLPPPTGRHSALPRSRNHSAPPCAVMTSSCSPAELPIDVHRQGVALVCQVFVSRIGERTNRGSISQRSCPAGVFPLEFGFYWQFELLLHADTQGREF